MRPSGGKEVHIVLLILILLLSVHNGSNIFGSGELLHYAHIALFKVLIIHLLALLNERIDNKDLPPGLNLLLHKGIDSAPVTLCGVQCGDGLPAWRKFVKKRYIQISVKGHCKSSWNRSGSHNHYVRGNLGFGPQFGPLLHTKSVLLVNYGKSKVFKLHVILNYRVGAHQNLYGAIHKPLVQSASLLCLGASCKQGAPYSQRVKHFGDILVVLLRKNLCGCHYASLIAVVAGNK